MLYVQGVAHKVILSGNLWEWPLQHYQTFIPYTMWKIVMLMGPWPNVKLQYTLSYFCTTYSGKDEILDDDTLSCLLSGSLVVVL